MRETTAQHGFGSHRNVTVFAVTLVVTYSETNNTLEGHFILYCSHLKKWGGHVPYQIAPMVVLILLLFFMLLVDFGTSQNETVR